MWGKVVDVTGASAFSRRLMETKTIDAIIARDVFYKTRVSYYVMLFVSKENGFTLPHSGPTNLGVNPGKTLPD